MSFEKNTALATLEQEGFKFPESFGLTRHPFLDDDGQPRDPATVGFEPCTVGGGTPALELEFDRFRLILLSDCGCGVPETAEWETAEIHVEVDPYGPEGYDLISMSGLEWKQMCS